MKTQGNRQNNDHRAEARVQVQQDVMSTTILLVILHTQCPLVKVDF
jgi:hypothetical protein